MEALVLVLQDIRPSPSSYMSTHQSPLPEALDVLDLGADKLLELELSLGASDGLNPLRAAVLYERQTRSIGLNYARVTSSVMTSPSISRAEQFSGSKRTQQAEMERNGL